jgi:hypothetical protein
MSIDYRRQVEDHFLLQAVFHAHASNVTNRKAVYRGQAEPVFRVTANKLVRAPLKGRYAVATMYVEHDGEPTLGSEAAWTIPRNRVLHFTAALRFLASDDSDDVDFVDDLIDPARVVGMAETWALWQGLIQ